MKIDIFNHIRPKEFVKHLLRTQPKMKRRVTYLPSNPAIYDVEARKKIMSKYKIDMEVLTLASPAPDTIPFKSEDALKACKIVNQSIARISELEPERFIGIASLPMNQPDNAVDEMKNAIKDLGLKGIQVSSNIRGEPLDSKRFLPIFELAMKMDIPILIHPAFPISYKGREYEREFNIERTFGWPYETTVAVSRLVFSGLLERYPNLKIVAHHLGGTFPYNFGRLRGKDVRDKSTYDWLGIDLGWKISKHPIHYYQKVYGDTATVDRATLRLGYDFFGPDRIVFGTDYPFGSEQGEVSIRRAIDAVEQEQIPEDDKKKILESNARRLLKI